MKRSEILLGSQGFKKMYVWHDGSLNQHVIWNQIFITCIIMSANEEEVGGLANDDIGWQRGRGFFRQMLTFSDKEGILGLANADRTDKSASKIYEFQLKKIYC